MVEYNSERMRFNYRFLSDVNSILVENISIGKIEEISVPLRSYLGSDDFNELLVAEGSNIILEIADYSKTSGLTMMINSTASGVPEGMRMRIRVHDGDTLEYLVRCRARNEISEFEILFENKTY